MCSRPTYDTEVKAKEAAKWLMKNRGWKSAKTPLCEKCNKYHVELPHAGHRSTL